MKPTKQLLVVLGMPGAGKDTQIELLLQRRGMQVIRTGDLVRVKAQADSSVAAALKAGELVSDNVVNQLVLDAFTTSTEQLLVSDGFPRDMAQATWLEQTLAQNNIELVYVLYIRISDPEAITRLQKRGRADDTVETITHRLKVFHTQTDPVVDYFAGRGKLLDINGEQSVEAVGADIQKALQW